ncbi:MAG TPA: DnaD domain protein [Pseudogracilibacillus sp.]|nr:DnaD domain protein [Pseudogracilibacillus sp.]
MSFIGRILPVEGYKVIFSGTLHVDYTKSLTHLYQPLIGINAIALYYTLVHEIELQKLTDKQTHHTLMSALNLPLDEIYEARIKLEGIGLLKTYKMTSESDVMYTYELISPFTPSEFFNDLMLSELLYRHVGKSKYGLLEANYKEKEEVIEGEQLTVAFTDVFQTFEPHANEFNELKKTTQTASVPLDTIDFTWIEQGLKRQMIPVEKVLTSWNKAQISQIMHLYDLDLNEIEKSVLWALTDENELDIDEFHAACHDLFKVKHNDVTIELTQKEQIEPKQEVKEPKKLTTKEEQLTEALETMSPKDLLEDLSSGGHASESDMKLIRDIMSRQGLETPVMNVLIHYVLLQSNMQLSRAYLEKIASHWSRANLTSAKEAMDFAKVQNQPLQDRKRVTKNSKEVIPDWFKDRDKKSPASPPVNDKQKVNEIDRAAMLERFKKTLE